MLQYVEVRHLITEPSGSGNKCSMGAHRLKYCSALQCESGLSTRSKLSDRAINVSVVPVIIIETIAGSETGLWVVSACSSTSFSQKSTIALETLAEAASTLLAECDPSLRVAFLSARVHTRLNLLTIMFIF